MTDKLYSLQRLNGTIASFSDKSALTLIPTKLSLWKAVMCIQSCVSSDVIGGANCRGV